MKETCHDTKLIPVMKWECANGLVYRVAVGNIIVDAEDYDRLSQHIWHDFYGYAMTCIDRTDGRRPDSVLMHRLLSSPDSDRIVHHINRNRLDNRRSNLQVMTRSEHAKLHLPDILAARKANASKRDRAPK